MPDYKLAAELNQSKKIIRNSELVIRNLKLQGKRQSRSETEDPQLSSQVHFRPDFSS